MIVSYGGVQKALNIHALPLLRAAKYMEQDRHLDACDTRNGFEEFGRSNIVPEFRDVSITPIMAHTRNGLAH